jgi:hypothetical protein
VEEVGVGKMKKIETSKVFIWTIGLTFLCLFLVIWFAGGGHGTYLPANLIFPYSMIIGYNNDRITDLAMILALVQIPVYGIVLGIANRFACFNIFSLIILSIHFLAVVVVMGMDSKNF